MTRNIQELLERSRTLSAPELEELIARLDGLRDGLEREEQEVGRRGLASLTEAAAGEDWSAYYPSALQQA